MRNGHGGSLEKNMERPPPRLGRTSRGLLRLVISDDAPDMGMCCAAAVIRGGDHQVVQHGGEGLAGQHVVVVVAAAVLGGCSFSASQSL